MENMHTMQDGTGTTNYRYIPAGQPGALQLLGIESPQGNYRIDRNATAEGHITRIVETQKGQNQQSRKWDYDYDEIDRLQTARRDDGQNRQNYAYTLDAADNLTSIASPEETRTYSHDAGNRIKGYQYDANGNLTEDDARTYQWNAENRLIGIGYKNAPQKKTQFKYDGKGQRVAAIETDGTKKSETHYTWCGNRICQARDGKDKAVAYYFDEGTYRPQNGERTYYAKDHLGSVRDILDSTGKNLARYDYAPYGGFIGQPVKVPDFGYAGMHYHAPSGLYLTKFRAYNPKTGRWLSRDPIEEAGGINLYGYVSGNPITYTDTLGLAKNFWCMLACTMGGTVIGSTAGEAVGGVGATVVCTASGPGAPVCIAIGAGGGKTLGSVLGGVGLFNWQ
jgi:RHS repeat-associated protein